MSKMNLRYTHAGITAHNTLGYYDFSDAETGEYAHAGWLPKSAGGICGEGEEGLLLAMKACSERRAALAQVAA